MLGGQEFMIQRITWFEKKLENDIRRQDHDHEELNIRLVKEMDSIYVTTKACKLMEYKAGFLDSHDMKDEDTRDAMLQD